MLPLQIRRFRNTSVDPKEALRAYVDRLPPDKQRAFVALAIELMSARHEDPEREKGPASDYRNN